MFCWISSVLIGTFNDNACEKLSSICVCVLNMLYHPINLLTVLFYLCTLFANKRSFVSDSIIHERKSMYGLVTTHNHRHDKLTVKIVNNLWFIYKNVIFSLGFNFLWVYDRTPGFLFSYFTSLFTNTLYQFIFNKQWKMRGQWWYDKLIEKKDFLSFVSFFLFYIYGHIIVIAMRIFSIYIKFFPHKSFMENLNELWHVWH